MEDMKQNEKRVLVEKHLISPNLSDESKAGARLLSEDESLSIMINEEDHIRIQVLLSGFQLDQSLKYANEIDDWMEEKADFAFDEKRGYLTSQLYECRDRAQSFCNDAFTGIGNHPPDEPHTPGNKPAWAGC